MILTDREIRVALRQKQIMIDPLPDLGVAITSAAIDLTLSENFVEWSSIGAMQICPGRKG